MPGCRLKKSWRSADTGSADDEPAMKSIMLGEHGVHAGGTRRRWRDGRTTRRVAV
jgi:hypothetical protein